MARLEIPIKVDIYKIEELIDQLKHLQTYKLFAGDEMTLVDRDEVVEIITDHVKAEVSPPDQRWIPCSERLPKEKDAGILKKFGTEKMSEYVLVTVDVRGERMTVVACTYDGKWNLNMKYAFPDCKVVAWMPLPEPWEGGQSLLTIPSADRRFSGF